jgi:hypothetical protein
VYVSVKYAYVLQFGTLREGCGEIYGYGALAYAAFAAYNGNFVFDFAHPFAENLLLLEKFLSVDVN